MAKEESKHIGDNVRRLRTSKNMTQKCLAKLTNINQASISNIENGQHIPTLPTVISIASAFGVSVSDIDPRLADVSTKAKELADDSMPNPTTAPSADYLKRLLDQQWESLTAEQKLRIMDICGELH